jgi:hypothetical protein
LGAQSAPRDDTRPTRSKSALLEALVIELFFLALAFTLSLGALVFAAPKANPIFCSLRFGLGPSTLFAILVEG